MSVRTQHTSFTRHSTNHTHSADSVKHPSVLWGDATSATFVHKQRRPVSDVANHGSTTAMKQWALPLLGSSQHAKPYHSISAIYLPCHIDRSIREAS